MLDIYFFFLNFCIQLSTLKFCYIICSCLLDRKQSYFMYSSLYPCTCCHYKRPNHCHNGMRDLYCPAFWLYSYVRSSNPPLGMSNMWTFYKFSERRCVQLKLFQCDGFVQCKFTSFDGCFRMPPVDNPKNMLRQLKVLHCYIIYKAAIYCN